jgi:hypothetical protein
LCKAEARPLGVLVVETFLHAAFGTVFTAFLGPLGVTMQPFYRHVRILRRALYVLAIPALIVLQSGSATLAGEKTAASLPSRLEQTGPLAETGARLWQAAGYNGQGNKVAVLDSGFHGYRDYLGKGLPGQVTVKSFRFDGNLEGRDSQHGILCAEVIHALAPAAQLLLANWEPDHPEQFLEAVRWAREQGARIISCSCIMPSWSNGEGGGPNHEALAQLLGSGDRPGDLICFASAGNVAQRHWAGLFHGDGNGFHEWQPGQRDNPLTPWGHEPVYVELCWKTDAAYDLFVFDQRTGSEVARSVSEKGKDRFSAVVKFEPQPDQRYVCRVRLAGGQPGRFHCFALSCYGLGSATAEGSVCFPADGGRVVAVGAVDTDGRRMSYSACGAPEQPKPDLVAAVPYVIPSSGRTFGGTSAAAPQAAGLAALWLSRHPDATAAQVRAVLRDAAADLAAPGRDSETGHGLFRLPDDGLALNRSHRILPASPLAGLGL